MVDLIHSILYPFSSKENAVNTIFAAIINIGWFAILPLFLVNGYLVRMIRETIKGNEKMPDWPGFGWRDWGNLLKHGFFFTLIMFIYMAIPFIIAYFGTVVVITRWFILLSVILFLILMFLLPMALVMYSATESFFQAFNLPEIFSRILKHIGHYLLTYLIYLVFGSLALFLARFLGYFSGLVLMIPAIIGLHGFAQIIAKTQ